MTALCGFAQNFTQLLLARIGVGVGEAGSGPPSQSIIADLYPPEKRASAMAIYSLGVLLGGGLGIMIGGNVAHAYGWRVAMMVVGIPGVVLALIVRFVIVEPRRGLCRQCSVWRRRRSIRCPRCGTASSRWRATGRRCTWSAGSCSPRWSAMR
ncbi:MFS transporter [Sphingomonas sp. MMS24-JH45]